MAEDTIFDYDNRGGFGGNGFDAQKNGSKFFKAGADRDELKKALAIDVRPVNPLRDMEYAKMQSIVERSKQLLATVTRRESSSTLACGHFAQFTKAVKAGCTTPFANIADKFGKLNETYLCSLDD